jgi:oligoribonuclease NrnB/cAMP/cGMP phosphodiesterase (DHH superfamily)
MMRIITRPDFDGIVCAALLCDALEINYPVKWVEPHTLQKGRVEIRKGDIIANLPYDPRCALWFDHHYTNRVQGSFKGAFEIAPSAAGIIFEYYRDRFKRDYSELVAAVDKIDSAYLTLDEVLHPEKYAYVLLSMTVVDGDHPDEDYWNQLLDLLRNFDIQQVLNHPDVSRRCQNVIKENLSYTLCLKEHTRLKEHVAITDFRPLERVRIRYDDSRKRTIIVNVGHSIFNRHCKVNAGLLLSDFGGGGHRGAGSARFPASKTASYIPRIIDALLKNENNETDESMRKLTT